MDTHGGIEGLGTGNKREKNSMKRGRPIHRSTFQSDRVMCYTLCIFALVAGLFACDINWKSIDVEIPVAVDLAPFR